MDRIMSDEERLRRAEAVAERRKNKYSNINPERIQLEKNNSKSRKVLIQILVCLLIYCGLYYVKNLPEDDNIKKQYTEKINWLLNNDIDFRQIYNNIFVKNKDKIKNEIDNENTTEDNNQVSSEDITFCYGIGGELEENKEEENTDVMDDDAKFIKANIILCNPLENGVITSRYGEREASKLVSANHRGIDIGASTGTEIKSACDGEVVEVSTSGDFGKHIKVQNGDVTFIYAHCSKLVVNKGDKIKIGQKIAEVGSTGRATGPHLHFEIRRGERVIDPELIMNFEK